jgi:hypothetical protein
MRHHGSGRADQFVDPHGRILISLPHLLDGAEWSSVSRSAGSMSRDRQCIGARGYVVQCYAACAAPAHERRAAARCQRVGSSCLTLKNSSLQGRPGLDLESSR